MWVDTLSKVDLGPVLIVEDDEALRSAMKFSLEVEGYRVETFQTAEQLLMNAPSDAVCLILDYFLPGLNGLSLLARLRSMGVDAPAMLITSHPSAILRARAASAGAPIIEKPLMGDAIVRTVNALVSARNVASAISPNRLVETKMLNPRAMPQSFKKIVLTLAREPGHPDGDRGVGYEFVAPLDAQDHIDAAQWREHRTLCRVTRFRRDEPTEIGHLVRRPGGSWAFRYDIMGDEDDEAGFHFGEHAFRPGEYVSISEDGALRPYQVLSVMNASGRSAS